MPFWTRIDVVALARESAHDAPVLLLNRSLHEGRERLARLDDIGRQHPAGLRAEVAGVMRRPRGDEESVPCPQDDVRTALHHHLDLAGDDVADLFSRMNMPSGLDSRRDLRDHLHDLAT